jgi:hypothetical protein
MAEMAVIPSRDCLGRPKVTSLAPMRTWRHIRIGSGRAVGIVSGRSVLRFP